MLFNSYMFIFLFLPVTFFLFYLAIKYSSKFALGILLIASLIFYSWCNYYFGIILLISISINFLISKYIIETSSQRLKKQILTMGIIANLGCLAYFKYTDFIIQTIDNIARLDIPLYSITLPLGISFFTFTQIAYLVDSYKGYIKQSKFLNYALFVSYFPHLIAGPIIHHKEVMPQFEKINIFKLNSRNVLIGLTIFSLGLFKKVVMADHLAKCVIPVFDTYSPMLSTLDAWIGALAYTFELYFDFSGYSDMAIGISLLFGIKLPINFYSPYKATNIVEFWRRWNITLSRFLRDYLYIPLGGNRKGLSRRYINLMITMLLGGLWHGANWTFVIWGGLHGLYLCLNHGWMSLKKYFGITNKSGNALNYLSILITFMAVVIAWVFFRAPNFKIAFHILKTMFFVNSISWHINCITISIQHVIFFIATSFFICWGLPNIYQFLSKYRSAILINYEKSLQNLLSWKPNFIWVSYSAMIFMIAVSFIQDSKIFLYFQF